MTKIDVKKLDRSIIVPNEIFCMDLTGLEISIYVYLLYCENKKTFTCCPSLKRMAERVRASKNTVRNHLTVLEDKGLIEIKSTRSYITNMNWTLEIKILSIKKAYEEYLSYAAKQSK